MKRGMDVARILQGLSHKVCSTILPKLSAFKFVILVFEISTFINQQLVAALRGHVKPGFHIVVSGLWRSLLNLKFHPKFEI